MKKLLFALFMISFLLGCGSDSDNDSHHPVPQPPLCTYTYTEWGECQVDNTQVRTVISQEPSGCEGDPVLTQACTYIPPTPEPTDCCPTQEGTLKCSSCTADKPCLTTNPDITLYCTSKGYWYVKIKWGIIVVDKDPDTSCCSVPDTGICPTECPSTEPCEILYGNQQTEWILYYASNWYIGSKITAMAYEVIQ